MLRRILELLAVVIALGVQLPAHSEDIDLFAEPNPTPTTLPNVLIILNDDMGFSDIGCYGSEISTPNIDPLTSSAIHRARR